MAKKENINLLINKIHIQSIDRSRKDVNDFINALRSAESRTNPIRKTLLDVFHRIILDGHLQAIYKKRIRNVKNTRISYFEKGKDTSQINEDYFESPWFLKTIQHIVESIFWGHSLIEFETEKGIIKKANLIDRYNVRPELNLVVNRYHENTGFDYTQPPYSNYTLAIGEKDELGLFLYAAINTLLKQGGNIDFANFVEKYGSPIQEFQYDPNIPNARQETEALAAQAGNSAAIIVPKDQASLILHNGVTAGTDKLHDTFLQGLKDELSILILGQTMTTSDGSSRSQAEVHLSEQAQITKEDKIFVEYTLNYELKEKLIFLGIPISQAGKFKFVEENNLSQREQLDLDLDLNNIIEIDPGYFYDKYNIPRPKKQSGKILKKKLEEDKDNGYPFGGTCIC